MIFSNVNCTDRKLLFAIYYAFQYFKNFIKNSKDVLEYYINIANHFSKRDFTLFQKKKNLNLIFQSCLYVLPHRLKILATNLVS